STWAPLESVIRKLLTLQVRHMSVSRQEQRGRLSHSGITDLATQLHAMQEEFPEIRRFGSWSVMGCLLLYLVVIGPLDYFLVQRVLKRPSVTWWTLPAAVVIAGSLAVVTAQQVNGTDARANQVDFVDISVASDPS